MAGPKFSVVIPTRERADTLRFALRSCLDQNYEDYEIVVCDNCSSPTTKEVVDSFNSPRIVYHRSPTPLCMRDNWNLAYSLASGKYITYIGDDDGLMPFAFSQLASLIRQYGVKAIRWNYAFYSWPNIARADLANYLQLSLSKSLEWFEGRHMIRDVLAGTVAATYLPNVYHSLVAKEVLDDVRNRTGQVFSSYNCDTYSSFTVAYLVDQYLSISVPMTVSGFSGSSNNIAFGFMRGKHPNTRRLRAENAASGLEFHPWVPDLPTGAVVIADSFLSAKQDLFPSDNSLMFDRKGMCENLLQRMPIDDVAEWPEAIAEIRRSLLDDRELLSWFDERVRRVEPQSAPRETYRAPVEGLSDGYLHLDTKKYGIEDVAAAVELATKILAHNDRPIKWESGQMINRRSLLWRMNQWRIALILARQKRQ